MKKKCQYFVLVAALTFCFSQRGKSQTTDSTKEINTEAAKTAAGNAQTGYRIFGIVKDNYNQPLPYASYGINTPSDSIAGNGLTDVNGDFAVIHLPDGTYKVTIQYMGFADFTQTVTIKDKDIDLGLIKMQTASNTLAAVHIKSNVVPVEQHGDTTSYNAKAYKTNPDATAQDLIKKMPGMDMSSGTPTAQGETVTKVLVDNKPFFGNDATTALENLPADIIQQVQVYDEKSDQAKFTGFDDGSTTKTINIITKPEDRKGTFGKLYAGYGNDQKYNAGGDLNFFQGNRRISLIGMTNNINVQNFSSQDLTGIGGGGGRGHGGGRGSADRNFLTNPQSGISNTNSIGLNYSDNWGKKITVTGSYFFNNSKNTSAQNINRIYVSPEQKGQTYMEKDVAVNKNFNHRFNLRMNYQIDSNNSVLFVPTLSFQKTDNNSTMLGQTFDNDTTFLNQTDNDFENDGNAYNMSGFLLYRHKFKKRGRTLSMFANGSLDKNKGNSSLDADNLFADTTLNNSIQQNSNTNVNNKSVRANVNYTEPISKTSYIQARYTLGYQTGASQKYTYNFNPELNDYSDLDSQLTNVYNSDYMTNSLGLAYRVSGKKLNASIGVNYQDGQLQSNGTLPEAGKINREYENYLPYAFLRYRISKQSNLMLSYRASTDAPSVSQLQDVVDNENPLQLSSGNPDLAQDYQHNVRLRFRSANMKNSLSAFAMVSGTYTQDYIGKSTFVAPKDTLLSNGFLLGKGGQYTTLANMDGYWNVTGFGGIGIPINFIKSNLNLNLKAGFQRLPGIVNDQTNFANNSSAGFGITLSSNISQKVDFTLTSNGTYNTVKNTINTASNNNFYNQSTRLTANFIFWKGIVLNSDITNQFYTGLSDGYNQNYYLWNLSIGKKLFKKQQGELKLSVYDLLGQNQSIQRTVSEIYSQDVMTNVLSRYFMLTFTYTLRAFKGGATMPTNRNNRGNYHRWQH